MNPAILYLNNECKKVNFADMDELKKTKWYISNISHNEILSAKEGSVKELRT